jgi:hypothetical protein
MAYKTCVKINGPDEVRLKKKTDRNNSIEYSR